uniref:Ig-like domain-containing protein n=1 Tax=Anopheles atroparvus TaxID=41427 RepID=A0A182IJ13_ANOAO
MELPFPKYRQFVVVTEDTRWRGYNGGPSLTELPWHPRRNNPSVSALATLRESSAGSPRGPKNISSDSDPKNGPLTTIQGADGLVGPDANETARAHVDTQCRINFACSYVLAWKRGIAILTAGSVKVTPDPRVRLVNGYTLQIRDAVPQDAGDYICQIAMLDPREITHHVEILVPPKITHVTSGGHLQVRKGSPVRLECSATGNPMPNITWTRKNNLLPNGEEQFTNPVYVIENMDRHKGGTYICTANNGVGQVATSQIILHVLYPPEISVENPIVYSGEGQEAMLVCIVHGESQPEVLWHKDTMQIDQTERHVIENRGARHTLIIRKVHAQDFGNYSCIADNQLGKTRKTVTLTGKPKTAVFRSVPNSQWKDKYNISWIVDSHSPIEEYKLYYRQVDGDTLQAHDGIFLDNRKTQPSYMGDNMLDYNRKISSYDSYSYNNGYHNLHHKWSKTDWRDIVLPAFPYSHHYTQGISYLIRGLEPDQQYEARVQSR